MALSLSRVDISEVGVAELARTETMEFAMRHFADDIAARLHSIAPYDPERPSPHYRDTIEVDAGEDDGVSTARVSVGVPWAPEVEFGTSEMAAEAPLRRAAQISDFPNAAALCAKQIRSAASLNAYSSLPKKDPLPLPLTVVKRIGGLPKWEPWVDYPSTQVDAWGSTETAAYDTAIAARNALLALEGVITTDAVITAVEDDLAMFYNPDPVSHTDRYIFGVALTLHPK